LRPSTIGLRTPVWVIVLRAFFYGAFTSLQYTSMNTLVYADITEEETSSASSIASTMQQMSISFGVASAALATALFIPSRAHSNPPQMIRGIPEAFLVLGGFTVLSTIIFSKLKREATVATSANRRYCTVGEYPSNKLAQRLTTDQCLTPLLYQRAVSDD
jgi:hypothetical protein